MELRKGDFKFEELNKYLNDDKFLDEYKDEYKDYKVSFLPKVLGNLLVLSGNIVYGKKPSYAKFRAVEIIARVPYHSWTAAAFTLMTMFFTDEKKAMKLSKVAENANFSQENETMHVVVISHIIEKEGRLGFFRHTLIPMLFALFYYWFSYIIYLIKPKYSYELNFMFENHAFEQYDLFLKENEHMLKTKTIESEFLDWYGRFPRSQYDFFLSVRNDEIVHRNFSIHEIKEI